MRKRNRKHRAQKNYYDGMDENILRQTQQIMIDEDAARHEQYLKHNIDTLYNEQIHQSEANRRLKEMEEYEYLVQKELRNRRIYEEFKHQQHQLHYNELERKSRHDFHQTRIPHSHSSDADPRDHLQSSQEVPHPALQLSPYEDLHQDILRYQENTDYLSAQKADQHHHYRDSQYTHPIHHHQPPSSGSNGLSSGHYFPAEPILSSTPQVIEADRHLKRPPPGLHYPPVRYIDDHPPPPPPPLAASSYQHYHHHHPHELQSYEYPHPAELHHPETYTEIVFPDLHTELHDPHRSSFPAAHERDIVRRPPGDVRAHKRYSRNDVREIHARNFEYKMRIEQEKMFDTYDQRYTH